MVAATIPPITKDDLSKTDRRVLRQFRSWQRFHGRVKPTADNLLARLSEHSGCVLVAGCQRSGTTMLTRLIASASGFRKFSLTHDDELDAALILAGRVQIPVGFRYCFQTTYLNERYLEYRSLTPDQKLIWVLRDPFSVVHSMVHHWRNSALNRLYRDCVADRPDLKQLKRHHKPWRFILARTERACLAYRWKTEQILKIEEIVGNDRLLVLDYDDVVLHKEKLLSRVFAFIHEPYDTEYTQFVRATGLEKARSLSPRQRATIERLALPTYNQCLQLAIRP